ncbi:MULTISPECIES: dTDP-4-amino-4,6-dideoxygalactose transaminase [Idiomarina]|mgnify:FL=1|jgi:dTDP-4-amino-4,6-dideoxygalactose transaminase|uniref:dTDP-4-amino-4,6-dideoxygalactose transaminase n=1 Tax=Idiomarina TaxID=135575 RepID=UPI000C0B45DE|nr:MULTISPECIES: dTDP-4-amino-4,6-dideoxygalactose transaminase [Idiomarina]MAC34678.1 dTDP-4-amino-4,6-dideoxygalactose transaminase [Haliea sp.]MAO68557.1 dTDP-4-amino-4,6-dideoxygalactose transaminase [Idiomarina sp.]MBF81294.1 dTDP-4-amino-4,6-dideoxygalactose transaminase [Idiomarina sp.]|tara:strand:+ start:7918 stop:9048 length:1131 start_codon:yes stop_codon:yes gene_type:complete
MIPFNKPPLTGDEVRYITEALQGNKISGDGPFAKRCQKWFEESLPTKKSLLTPSCTAALELAAILIDVKPGDEVIMPSYTFVSTANAFVLRGAKIVFVDVRPDTMNIDETLIESAITEKTKAIIPVHYAGVGCEMDVIMDVANRHGLFVVEDAAQGMMSSYKGKALGTIGHLGAFSFHETKNYTSGGEGGLLIINDDRFKQRAEIIREKGTNRSQFFRGMVDKYQWVDVGSSYLPSELQAAYLWAQLESAVKINEARLKVWHKYLSELATLETSGFIELPTIPESCIHNAHMFYLKVSNLEERSELIKFLKEQKVMAAFHYVPLHSASAGSRFGSFHGQDNYTTQESERLVRLPLWYGMTEQDQNQVVSAIKEFYA